MGETDVSTHTVLCVDCKYYVRTLGMWLTRTDAKCRYGFNPTIDLVTGKTTTVRSYKLDICALERRDDYEQNCGTAGRYWSPRRSTPANTMLLLKRIRP